MQMAEFSTIASALHSAYGRNNVMPDESSLSLWYGMLKDIDYGICRNAVTQLISQNKFVPTIAEIRDKCATITTEQLPEWDEAWGMVLMAVRRYGYMNELNALESLPDAVRSVVKRMGYQNICQSENIGVERANFREAYKGQINYTKQQNVLSAAVRNEQAALIEQCANQLALDSRERSAANAKTESSDR